MRSRAASPRSRSCAASTSDIWAPMVNTGLNAEVGFWKIIAISAPRMRRSAARHRGSAGPGRRTRRTSADRRADPGSSRIAARPVTVLPQPVSPTTPTASPGPMTRSMPSRATVRRSSPWKARRSPRISSTGSDGRSRPGSSAVPRIEDAQQHVTDEVEAQHRDEDGEAGEGRHPPLVEDDRPAVRDHEAPVRESAGGRPGR